MAALSLSVGRADEHALDAVETPIRFFARDGERWREAKHGAVRILGQDALARHLLAQRTGRDGCGIDLDPNPQAAAAHVGHDVAANRAQALVEVSAEFGAAFDQALIRDYLKRGHPDRGGERV